MNSSKYRTQQLKYLASILKESPKLLESVSNNIDLYYDEWVTKKKDKSGNVRTYLDGTPKKRIIRPSLSILKTIQKKINSEILIKHTLPKNVHGGVKRKSNITNSVEHKGKKYLFTTDLKTFFPAISYVQIHSMFVQLGYKPHFAHWLTKFSSFRFELPQGTPTSTYVANLVFLPTDLKIIEFCDQNDITYTRYVDDLTFSSQKDFSHLLNSLLEIVTNSGKFKINHRKTFYQAHQSVTGVIIHPNYITAPTHIKLKAATEMENQSETKPFTIYKNNIHKMNPKYKSRKQLKDSAQ